jgi:lysophospholipase L1-like esterase
MKRLALALAAGIAAAALTSAVAPAKKPPAGKSAQKASPAKKTAARRRSAPKPPPVSAAQRAEAAGAVQEQVSGAVELGIQNAAAMVPFYEMLYRLESQPEQSGHVRVLQFGDSHTASDDWAGELRARFQQRFGDGGPGFTPAGRPFPGFRRYDSKAAMSRGWEPVGLLDREGDGFYGIGGVGLETKREGETLTLAAEGESLEFFYLQQPGGGRIQLEDRETPLDTIETDGPMGAGYYRKELPAGAHQLTARTLDGSAVRVFGWVLEKRRGMTWETLGVNGAQADLLLLQNADLLKGHIARRAPSLVVLAYGTNEARRPDWTVESYRDTLRRVIGLIREAAPASSILIVGAPDQMVWSRRKPGPSEGLERILAAQREAALEFGCGFWNLRTAMGGRASMKQWVQAGMAQGDYVHFTAQGYRLLGDALFELLTGQYGIFQTVRRQLIGSNENGQTIKSH